MGYIFSDMSLGIRGLQEQKRKMATSSSRVENMVKSLITSESRASPQGAVSRELSISFN